MSELTKTKVIDIQTGQAVKNVDNLTSSFVPLKKQIRDLMNELTQLEQGTEQYNRVAQQLADLQQRQREAAEAAKYSSKDFGEVMSNLTKVSLGVAGGINAISASMALLGGDSEKMQKALAPIQMMMAVIQGVSAIDTAIKSLKGLNNMFESLGSTSDKAAESVTALGTDIDSIGDKKVSVDVDTSKAEKSVTGLENDIDSIGDKEITVGVDTKKGETSVKKLDKSITNTVKDKKVKIDADTKKADKNIKGLETEIKSVGDKKVSIDADTTEATTKVEELKTEIETIPDKDINIGADTTDVVESVEDVTESLEDMADIDIEVKAEGIDTVTKDVKSLGEAEKTLATNAQTATTATNTLNTATKSTAASTTAMAAGAKTAAVATTTLAAGEGVATKASWTLTGALKAVGTAIKSVPIIGWIAMGITLLTSLIKLIGRANKESKEGVDIAVKSLEAERNRKEVAAEIAAKYREMRIELSWALAKLALLPKSGREYKETMEDVTKTLGLSSDYVEKFGGRAKDAKDYFIAMGEAQENLNNNLKEQEEAEKKINGFLGEVNDVFVDNYKVSEKVLDNLVEEGKIREGQRKELAKLRKDLIHGRTDSEGFNKSVKIILQEQLGEYEQQKKTLEDQQAALEEIVTENKNNLYVIQDESDAYDEQLKKQKEANDAYKEFLRKREDSQKSYIQTLEDMKIADAEYEGDWNRYADERKKKEERIYNDDLKSYKKQLKEKLITQQQYDDLLKERQEKYNNDTAQIQLETNRKMWEQQLNDALDAIEKEKQARIKAASEQYVSDTKKGVSTASDTRNIENEQAELDAILKTNEVLKERLEIVKQNKDESQEYADYVKSLQDQIAANEQKAQELELQIDEDSYNKRKKQAEDYYNSIDQLAADSVNKSIVEDQSGGKNLFVEQQKIELQAIRDKMDALKQAYEDGLMTQAEYNSRSLELQAEYVMKSRELDQQHASSILQTANTYAQTVQMIGSSISGVLQEVMSNYDENSEEYKKMAVANAVIQTISGQLGAFFSGVNSGVPAPWNFLLGGVLATAALATGLIGIANIKSGNLGGNISSSASNVGRGEYETTAYAQQTEMMSTVTDQRVYVLESDISSAQNNVSVMEADNTF